MTRNPALQSTSAEELRAKRAELANLINPLWLRLDEIDDELMHRQREERRARILAEPPAAEVAA